MVTFNLEWKKTAIVVIETGKIFSASGTGFNKKSASLALWLESVIKNNDKLLGNLAQAVTENPIPYGLKIYIDNRKPEDITALEARKKIRENDFCIEDGVGISSVLKIAEMAGIKYKEVNQKKGKFLVEKGYTVEY